MKDSAKHPYSHQYVEYNLRPSLLDSASVVKGWSYHARSNSGKEGREFLRRSFSPHSSFRQRFWAWRWYTRLPKPHRVHATIKTPSILPPNYDSQFTSLAIYFSEPAARLEDLGKPAISGVKIEPQVSGAWRWSSDDTLLFEPKQIWPAEKKFCVSFDRNFFPHQIVMDKLQYDFVTAPFAITIKAFDFYQDPINPKLRQVVATLEATHRVEPGEIEPHAVLEMIGHSPVFVANDPAPHFTVTFGRYNRIIYLRSSPLSLPKNEDWMRLTVSKGVRTSNGGAQSHENLERKTRVPAVTTAFRIASVKGTIVRNKAGEPEQMILVNTTAEVAKVDLARAIQVWLLPKRPKEKIEATEETSDDESDDEAGETATMNVDSVRWKSATDVPDEILTQAKSVEFMPCHRCRSAIACTPFAFTLRARASFTCASERACVLSAIIRYVADHNAVIPVPKFPREVRIEGNGGLLALSGERKISIRSRGLAAIKFEIDRVADRQINHLVSQTEGEFQAPEFKHGNSFDQDNISRIAREDQTIGLQNKWKANYSAFDFSEYLQNRRTAAASADSSSVKARGWDPDEKNSIKRRERHDVSFSSAISGLLVKKNADTAAMFSSLRSRPASRSPA